MARVKIAGTTGASENTIVFLPAGGHSHNGQNSSLIDSTAYSVYDFSPTFVGTEINPDRAIRQENNRIAFEDVIKRVVNNSVLAPAGIRLEPGSLNGSLIIANTITANQLAANTITASEIAANSITANELSSNIVLINNVIKSNNYDGTIASNGVITSNGTAGWAITYAGYAEFASTSIRGAINANSLTTPNLTIYSNGAIASNNFNVTSNGVVTANGATISGSVTANSGAIGGWTIESARFYAGSTYLYSNGYISVASGDFAGQIQANAGTIGGWTINSNSIISGSSALYSNGAVTFGNTVIAANGRITNGGYTLSSTGALSATGASISGTISGSTITGSTISGTTLTTDDGSNGVEITSDGYLRGVGGNGIRIKNSDGSTGSTQFFKNEIYTTNLYLDLLQVSNGTQFVAADINGIRMNTSGVPNLTLRRNYVANADIVRFRSASDSQTIGSISFNTSTTISYITTSDKRLKEDISPISNALSVIKNLEPSKYVFSSDKDVQHHGFIAQDVFKVYPYPVSVGEDDVSEKPWGIDYAKFTPLLTAGMKELIAKIEQLESRIQALEGV